MSAAWSRLAWRIAAALDDARESLAGGLLALPGTFLLLSLLIAPALVVLPVAFTDWEFGRGQLAFIGWRNFLELAEDARFAAALRNTIAYVLMVVPATVAARDVPRAADRRQRPAEGVLSHRALPAGGRRRWRRWRWRGMPCCIRRSAC